MNTDGKNKSEERIQFLLNYRFTELPFNQLSVVINAKRIQQWVLGQGTASQKKPSPTDLYLGGALMQYYTSGMYLVTGNVSDFPYPLFTRVGHIILQGKKEAKVLFILGIDTSILEGTSIHK